MTSASSNATYAGAPGVPDAAKFKTDAGAIAFAKHYVLTLNQVFKHPKVGVLESLTTPSCKPCKSQQSSVADLVRKNERIIGDQADFVSGKRIVDPNGTLIGVVLQNKPTTRVDKAGKVVRQGKATDRMAVVFFLTWDSGWRLSDVKRDATAGA